jgi:hypothetical protein
MGYRNRKVKNICIACDTEVTYINKDGSEHWRYHDGYIFCKNCYAKYVYDPTKPERWNKKYAIINDPKRINFKGKNKRLKINPRKGVCSLCGAMKGIDCKRTAMHHLIYDESDPLANTIELCLSCHMKEHAK